MPSIAMQCNPDTLSRTYQVQVAGGDGGAARAVPFRLSSPAIESIKLDLEIDATYSPEHPDLNVNAVALGIAPRGSVVKPTSTELLTLNSLSQTGTLEIMRPSLRWCFHQELELRGNGA